MTGSGGTTVLVLNVGSSSVKFALVDTATGERPVQGAAERVGTGGAVVRYDDGSALQETAIPGGDHRRAVREILAFHRRHRSPDPVGVGHRVVHGGARFTESVLVDDEVLAAVKELAPLAPLHNPPALSGMTAVRELYPDLPQVAVFDTAYHQTMPPAAYRYAVPEAWYADLGIRRYGFHGTSHRYVAGRTAQLLGRDPGELDLVVAHLGNGCSATAVHAGESVDTTMGLTPLEGLVMGSRSGTVDPGVFGYLQDRVGLDAAAVTEVLNTRSGLAALSGRTNDMRELEEGVRAGDPACLLAVDVFVHRLAASLAGLVASLGRLDALVFTGGIGQHSALIRARTLARLGFLGLRVDDALNAVHGSGAAGRVTTPGPPVALVVPTDEELLIARDTARVVADAHPVRRRGTP